MASRQVLKLCEMLKEQHGIVCKPETFHVERMNHSFNKWNMDIDVDNSTNESVFNNLDYCATCTSSYYIKDLVKFKALRVHILIDDNEVVLHPSKRELISN